MNLLVYDTRSFGCPSRWQEENAYLVTLVEGVQMTDSQLQKVFKANGLLKVGQRNGSDRAPPMHGGFRGRVLFLGEPASSRLFDQCVHPR
jgi:hypothetical protein